MKKKSGMTVAVLVVAMGIMSIALGTAVIFGARSIQDAGLDRFKSQFLRVEEAVALYYDKNGSYPLYEDSGSIVEVQTFSLGKELANEIMNKNDYNEKMYVLDIAKLAIANINIGSGVGNTDKILGNKDVFLINDVSGNIYYFSGIEYYGKKIHAVE